MIYHKYTHTSSTNLVFECRPNPTTSARMTSTKSPGPQATTLILAYPALTPC
ncbi:unnamed protein product [Periconia digitata]|uniref:Uncharacterized protein n=1 Tax=Periconia digitata TaxID=1303443 RepID=A0A9W4UJ27_9PLEO|nr:unnamed protein product [Periconia digitata]